MSPRIHLHFTIVYIIIIYYYNKLYFHSALGKDAFSRPLIYNYLYFNAYRVNRFYRKLTINCRWYIYRIFIET